MKIRNVFPVFAAFLVVCSLSVAAVSESAESTLSAQAQSEGKPPWLAFELGYFAPDFPNYGGPFSAYGRKVGAGARLAFEAMIFSGPYGKFGPTASIGYGKIAKTSSSPFLEVIPLEAGFVYRADFMEDQLLVPFGHAGVVVTHTHQQHVPGTQRFNGYEYGGGVALCLDFIDRMAARSFNQAVGIQNTYAVFDYRQVEALAQNQGPNLSRRELRFSLRFEF